MTVAKTLGDLVAALPSAAIQGPTSTPVAGIAYDSRRVEPGFVFVAVPSVSSAEGGERFVPEALARGAVAIVTQGNVSIAETSTVRVPDARAALGHLSAEFYGHPSERLALYAVTGTDGKTTTSFLLEQILRRAGLCTGLVGTVQTRIGDRTVSNLERMTTPEALDLQRTLREMVDAGVTHAVMEASSHALALQRVRGCRFAACALTNITADHVEFHGSWEEYFRAKLSLFTDYAAGRPAILNRQDAHFACLARDIPGPIVTYAVEDDADVCASNLRPIDRGWTLELAYGGETAHVSLSLPGRFNVANALAAAALATEAGLPLEHIAGGLEQATLPPGRLERVERGQPFGVVVDYAHTMNAFRSVLATLRESTPPPRRLIAVFGATGDRDHAKRPVLAQVAREFADFFVVTDEDPYGERPESIIDEVVAGLPREEEGQRYAREDDRGRAIELALRRARPGDTVVILGKGHEQSMVVNGQKKPWSDVAAASAALESRS